MHRVMSDELSGCLFADLFLSQMVELGDEAFQSGYYFDALIYDLRRLGALSRSVSPDTAKKRRTCLMRVSTWACKTE